jgi:hypothetical protein
MTFHLLSLLAQIDRIGKLDTDLPPFVVEASPVTTWLVAGVLLVGIIAITFKPSKRNLVEKE